MYIQSFVISAFVYFQWSNGQCLGLVRMALGLSLGLKKLVMFTSLHNVDHSLTCLLIFG